MNTLLVPALATPCPTTVHRERSDVHRKLKGFAVMLLHEELARERIRDMLQAASDRREARSAKQSRKRARAAGTRYGRA
jgi:hypothetical protein